MAAYYNTSNNHRDSTIMLYLRDPLLNSCQEEPVLPNNLMMYVNSGTYSDTIALQHQNNRIEVPSSGSFETNTLTHQQVLSNLGGSRVLVGRNEILLTQTVSAANDIIHGGQNNLQGQRLSLSLRTQIPTGIQMPSLAYRNQNLGITSFSGTNPGTSSRDEQIRNGEYFPPGFSSNQVSNKGEWRTTPNSKYLKAAQQLLDEVVNLRTALKQADKEKKQNAHDNGAKNSTESDERLTNHSGMISPSGASSNPRELASKSPCELSNAEKQDLQNKLTKLLSMLDEVDRKYKQYYHQMQIVVSSFDAIAGYGAAKPYTSLASQTISCHFRCLHDAIADQIKATRKSLGENDDSGNSKVVGITRLRYVDQQLRQQRALQQMGMMQQHAWRPQRGLPESSVTILRAWLFEHFLHPYPKDSDKIMLARQTGLTRSQVSNWFINARVRLWKPMVEEMYKEEIGDAEIESNSSFDNAATKKTKGNNRNSNDRGEDLQQSASTTAIERHNPTQLSNSKSDHTPGMEMACSTMLDDFQNVAPEEPGNEFMLARRRVEQRANVDDCNLFPEQIVQSAYQTSDFGRFGTGSGVSLTLGLQHCEATRLPLSGGNHHDFLAAREDGIYDGVVSAVGETGDYECMNTGNQQHRFSSGNLYHDFVV